MSVDIIKNILDKESANLAFIVGNGINRYNLDDSVNISWDGILMKLWEEVFPNIIPNIPEGISLTEFYDILQLGINASNKTLDIQKEFCKYLKCLKPRSHHKFIVNRIFNMGAPLLTTNFDHSLSESHNLSCYKTSNENFIVYPWNCYYAKNEVRTPTESFGLWHIHGMQNIEKSIRLGLTDYMGCVKRASSLLHMDKEQELFTGKNANNWKGITTWLHIIFNKSLFIFGLNLNENEVFLRWLLIERAKYLSSFPRNASKAWFITDSKSRSDGKDFFLKNVGVEVIEMNNYDDVYQKIWCD